jgi:formylglycine-generating enzyme required for sulfatase activity
VAGDLRKNTKDGLTYVWIPPGDFQMGCSAGDGECDLNERPPHKVTISKGFWLSQTPTTQAAYAQVMRGASPSRFKGPQLPVEQVSWDDAKAYCEAVGGRLPTEAEWEYAARGGNQAARYGELDKIAWYGANSGATTHDVATKQPNAWKLYDMLGNVWQWTADWYGEKDYSENRDWIDPQGPASGTLRTLRGGSWVNYPRYVRVSFRYRYVPGNLNYVIGARCVGESVP